jgi:predicted negative regulator of RcsB-dependent stress response
MQDKFKEILKKISIFTTDPDKDWRRLFVGLIFLMLIVFVWSTYFYTQVKQEIIDSESMRQRITNGNTGERENELRKILVDFEAKKQKNDSLISGSHLPVVLDLSDPLR